ncbi:MAG: hypothetical protein LBC49_05130 [Bacteroidales bacterium]|jgi:hypothetical protein|nr:hypothetical protein [Bacteroidales bacterium]
MDNFEKFTAQLDAFINKYYKNILFKGILLSVGLLTGVFLLVNFVEIFYFLSSSWRFALLLIFAGAFIFSFFYWILIPVIKIYGHSSLRIFKRMSYREAAVLLSKKYPELDDNFYNVLELKNVNSGSSALLQAAIEQISGRFLFYRFANSIQYKSNRKYFKYIAIPLVLLVLAVIFYPSQIVKSSNRIIHYDTFFEREFPFTIKIENPVLETQYEEDFTLKINVIGEQLPAEISIDDGRVFKTKKIDANNFSYTFKTPQQSISFRIIAGNYKSEEHILQIIPKPIIEEMRMIIDYPSYTGRKQEVISNTFDASVPYGTRVTWDLTVKNADDLFADYTFLNSGVSGGSDGDSRLVDGSGSGSGSSGNTSSPNGVFSVNASNKPNYRFSSQVMQSFNYQIIPYLSRRRTQDTLRFFIESIADAFPRIAAEEFVNSNDITKRFFSGSVSDDYGFHSLMFKATITNASNSSERTYGDTLSVAGFTSEGTFTYFVDLNNYELQAGDELSYYFEIRDNDPFNGFKPANSNFYSYKKQSLEEIREAVAAISENIEDKLSSTMEKMKLFKKQADNVTKQLLEKKNLDWNDRKTLEDLVDMQKSIANEYNQLSDEMQQRSQKEQQLNELNEDILQQQKELQELFDKVFDKETMAKLEELQRLLNENKPKNEVLEGLEKLKESGQDLAKELERNLELYRQLEFEKNLEKALEDLKNLRAEQLALKEELLKKAGGDSLAAAALLEEQRKINEKFDALRKDLDKLDKQNKALSDPNSFKNPQEKSAVVKNSLDKAADALKKNVDISAPVSQKDVSAQKDSALQKDGSMQKGSSAQKEAQQGSQQGSQRNSQQQKKNASDAAENQQKAADEMQDLQDDLEQQQAEMEEENNGEDAEFIRKLLKSVLRVSFKQEELLYSLGSITVKDPRYAQIIREQNALKTEIGYIVDSINAIARRQSQVASFTSGEIRNLLDHSRKALDRLLLMNDVRYRYYNDKNTSATGEQQYTMTSLNNIALMLEESLNKMDEKRRSSKSKKSKSKGMPSASCDNPGSSGKKPGKKQSSGSPKEMQDALNKQLEALKKMMEQRARESQAANSGKQSGATQQQGQQGKEFSEQFGKAVMQQEMIRRALQDLLKGTKTDAATSALYNKILGDMERTERDLVNRTLTNETLLRQQQILTRLLEAESAEMKREQEEKRESRAGAQFTAPASGSLDDFMRQVQGQKDVLRSATPALKPYYKDKVNRYYYE